MEETEKTFDPDLRVVDANPTLRKNGVLTKGTVVGREKVDQSENDVFYVFYQFRPDFVMRLVDNASKLPFYKLPIGSEIKVC